MSCQNAVYCGAYGWFDGFQKLASKTSFGSSILCRGAFSFQFPITLKKDIYMTSEILLDCAQSFNSIIGTQYIIHLGRAGKHKIFRITIDKEDAHHLMGLHYLLDYPDRRNRAKIFDDILQSKKYREHLASSDYWNKDLETRITCTSLLSAILDDNGTIFHYNPKRLTFYSKIKADYLIAQENYHLSDEVFSDIYIYL